MNTDLNSGMLKMGVGLQSFKDELLTKILAPQPTPVGQQISQVMMSLFKHLVQGVLVISAGTLAYTIAEKTALAEVTGLSGMMAFLAGTLAVKYFYFPSSVVDITKINPESNLSVESNYYDRNLDPQFNDEVCNAYHSNNSDSLFNNTSINPND